MMGQLAARGHELTPDPADADVLVVNTCSFIDPAKQESIDTILEMAEYKKKTGQARNQLVIRRLCPGGALPQRYPEAIARGRRTDRDQRGREDRRRLAGRLGDLPMRLVNHFT